MKRIGIIAIAVALLAWASVGRAEIISWGCASDGDTALTYCEGNWDAATYTMHIVGEQAWGPAHVGTLPLSDRAYFGTDTDLDPTVTMHNTIENDTTFAWTGYHINVSMNKAFTLSAATVYPPPGDWLGAITVSPAVFDGISTWVGQVDYTGGTPIGIGDSFDFSYKMSFLGSVQYAQEMIPVPEPGAIVLVLSGLMGLIAVRIARPAKR